MKKILTLLLAGIMIFSVTGCGKDENSNNEPKPTMDTVNVWGTYSTAKVMIDKNLNDNYVNLGKRLDVSLAKNEKEMGQIVITTENKVNSYDIIVSDLKSGNNILKAENIEVYHQKSIEVVTKTTGNYNENYPKGLTPDCILPLSVAKEYGENKINANSNQPVSFEIFAPENQPAGEYTGEFTVKVDDLTFSLPVTVTVWDYTLPEGTKGKSCMLIYQNELFYGEMDSSDEMYERYYEELLDHKMNAWHVPGTAESPEKMVESVLKYWDNPNFNGYGMPDLQANNEVDYWAQKRYLVALGKASTPDKILFDKAYFYHTVIDEPYAFSEKREKVNSIISKVNNMFNEVMEQLSIDGVFNGNEDYKLNMEKSLKNIPQIVTSYYDSKYDGSNLTYCPPIQYVNTVTQRENLEKHKEDIANKGNNVETWTYTCNNPAYPYPTTHIDDYLIGSRIMKWMQKSYDITGYLSWSVNQYSKIVPFQPGQREEINPYIDPQRVISMQGGVIANGDGYLFYPGKKYNSEKPFNSIRTKSLRDGQDDYDALCLLDELYQGFDTYYDGKGSIDSDKILNSLYENLFSGTIYNSSDVMFDSARKTVAKMIENANREEKFVCDSQVKGNDITFTLYANEGYTVKVNNEVLTGTQSGNGNKFTKTMSLNDFNGSITFNLSKGEYVKDYVYTCDKVVKATDFNDKNEKSNFNVREENTLTISGGVANFIISSVDRGDDSANTRYKTGFTLRASAFDVPLKDIAKIYFEMENLTDEDINFIIYVESEGRREELTKVKIGKNSKTKISLNSISAVTNKYIDKADGLFFAFDNAVKVGDKVVLCSERNITMKDIYYVKK